jgi:hypothetical protein
MKERIYTITIIEGKEGNSTKIRMECPRLPKFAKECLLRELLGGERIIDLRLS